MAACLTSKSDKIDKISIYINECKRMNIKVLPPHINMSNKYFTPSNDDNNILFGFMAIKGLGSSEVDKILENRPFNSIDSVYDVLGNIKSVVILIKSGAIPCKNKKKALYRFANSIYNERQYKPVKTLPSKQILLTKWDINTNDYKINNKIDKDTLLRVYNDLKEKQFNKDESERRKKHLNDFYQKYAVNEHMWEFDTLSMFVTYDPLDNLTNKYITCDWFSTNDKEKITMLSVIVGIDRKKDKNGNVYCFSMLYTPYGIIEGTIWSSVYKRCMQNIKKGQAVAIIGKKENNQITIEDIMTIEEWTMVRKINSI